MGPGPQQMLFVQEKNTNKTCFFELV